MAANRVSNMQLRKLALAVLAAALAFAAWRNAASTYWLAASPLSAPPSLRANPRIASAAADEAQFSSDDAQPGEPEPIMEQSRAVLRSAPLDAAAMRQFALASSRVGDPNFGGKLLLAERISRRDLITEFALIDLSAQAGDDADALSHLDKLLTIYPRTGASVYPHLTAYLADPAFRRVLKQYATRPWFSAFLGEAVIEASDANAIAALFTESGIRLSKDNSATFSRLLSRLIDAGESGRARQIAVVLGDATMAALDDFSLTSATANAGLAPLTWQFHSDNLVQTQLLGGGRLAVEVQPGRPAVVAERVSLLLAGAYVLEQEVGGLDAGPPPLLEWQMRCGAGGADPVWRQPVPLDRDPIRYHSQFRVGTNCPAQHWQLIALATDRQTPAHFHIGFLAIRPK